MNVGVQFTGNIPANQSTRWFTFNWPQNKHIVWYVVPTSPRAGAPQVEWNVAVERASATQITYWITVKNLTNTAVQIEGRYAILN